MKVLMIDHLDKSIGELKLAGYSHDQDIVIIRVDSFITKDILKQCSKEEVQYWKDLIVKDLMFESGWIYRTRVLLCVSETETQIVKMAINKGKKLVKI